MVPDPGPGWLTVVAALLDGFDLVVVVSPTGVSEGTVRSLRDRHDLASGPAGRLSPRSINLICEEIGRWHDAEHIDLARHISPLRPDDLRHTFASALAEATDSDAYELERRLGHQSRRYIHRYTNPPEDIAAGYVENL